MPHLDFGLKKGPCLTLEGQKQRNDKRALHSFRSDGQI